MSKENAAPAVTGNGVLTHDGIGNSSQITTIPKWRENSNHKRAIRAVEDALTLDAADYWDGLAVVLAARLTFQERMSLAYAANLSLEPEDAEQAFCAAHSKAGLPISYLFSVMDEAVFWADLATPEERDAYCLACFRRMRPERQTAFLEFVQGRKAA